MLEIKGSTIYKDGNVLVTYLHDAEAYLALDHYCKTGAILEPKKK